MFGKDQKTEEARTILIVDDSEVDRTIAKKIIESMGHNTLIAENGQAGLDVVKGEKPDLILLDCEMPILGGVEMCRILKNNEDTEDIPVIFLTSVDTPRNIIDCFELDAENFLSKPINSKVLINQVSMILKEFFPS